MYCHPVLSVGGIAATWIAAWPAPRWRHRPEPMTCCGGHQPCL